MPDVHTIKTILRVQRGQEADLLLIEAATLANCVLEEQVDSDATPTPLAPIERLNDVFTARKAARTSGVESKYELAIIRTVLGSATEVERVWSLAGKGLTKDRSSTSLLLFECIMYLTYNRDLWGLEDMVEANRRRKSISKATRTKLVADQERIDFELTVIAT